MVTENDFLVLGRKYRPKDFSEVLAQDTTCKTISNSIQNNNIPSSYLFTGIRGIGKTSFGRIIAKTLNCCDKKTKNDYVCPCGACKDCIAVHNASHPDIIEIDAASHTGVDDIRAVIESAQYKPMMGLYKVYIIDEVHMLSKSAFNSLLKTLEEPPAHLVFVLATTEINKVPSTIKSRCQKFLLKRFYKQDIIDLLNKVLTEENINSEPRAIDLIASRSEGSARDALSILDQAISRSSRGVVNYDLVCEMIGFTGLDAIIALLKFIIAKDAKQSLDNIENIFYTSANIVLFFESLSDLVGYLCKLKMIDSYMLEEYQIYQEPLTEISLQVSLPYLTSLWNIINKGIIDLKSSHNTMMTAEMIIIKSIYASTLPSPQTLLKKLVNKTNLSLPEDVELKKKSNIQQNLSLDAVLYGLANENKFDLYYYMMNIVEISIDGDTLKIQGDKINRNYNSEIRQYIQSKFGSKISIMESLSKNIVPYKEKMKREFCNSTAYKAMSYFTEIEVEDVIINKNIEV